MSEDALPTIGDPVMLAEHRKRTNAPRIRRQIAARLRELAQHITRDEVAAGTVTGAVLVMLTDGPPVITWAGEVRGTDLDEAQHVLMDARMNHWRQSWEQLDGMSTNELVAERWRQRRQWEAKRALDASAEADEKPWLCEHCDRRFRTERGANQHERGCWKNPARRGRRR